MAATLIHLDSRAFTKWFDRLGSEDAANVRRRILLLRAHGPEIGMPNVRRINFLVSELRVPSGQRLYFTFDATMVVFVHYGNKDSQRRDIELATSRSQELHQR